MRFLFKKMANPQKENGFVPISKELLEAFAKIRISGEARQVLDFIILKTYGWGKKEDIISLSQFTKGTGLSKVAVCKAIIKLETMNIITKKGNGRLSSYLILKNYEQWKSLPKKVTSNLLPKKVMDITKKGKGLLPKKLQTIYTNTKDTITIDRPNSPSKIARDFLNDMDSEYRKKFFNEMIKKGLNEESVRRETLKFISYWTEPTKNGLKQRWETEKTFEVGRRLATWFSRANEFQNNKSLITNIIL